MAKVGTKAQRTRATIMESALRLFSQRGYDAVSVEEITADAGVAKGSFYTYFSTKSDIILQEFLKIDAFYRDFAAQRLASFVSASDKLLAFTEAQMRYVRDEIGNENLKILYANQASQRGPDKIILSQDRAWVRVVTAIMEEGQEKGEFRLDLDAKRLAELFNRSERGIFLDWCIRDGGFDLLEEALKVTKAWILSALRADTVTR